MNTEKGLLAIFDCPNKLLEGVKKLRSAQFQKLETFTPFPVHGLEHALGLKRSWIPWLTFVMCMVGMIAGFGLQVWTSAYAWPIIIGGKPFVSWPAFIPVTFETAILIGGVSTVFALFFAIKLPCYKYKVLDARLTNDRFGIYICATDPQFDAQKIGSLMSECLVEEMRNIE